MHTLRHAPYVHFFQLPLPALCVAGFMCTCFVSLPPLFVAGAISSSFGREGCVNCTSLYAFPLWAPQSLTLRQLCLLHHSWLPGPAICAARVECAGWVCMLYHSQFPKHAVWGHSPWAVNGLKSAAFSVCCPPSPCFAWFSETLQLHFGSACEGVSLCMGAPPVSRLPPSLGAQAPAQNFNVFSLFMSLSSLLPHFREVSLSPLEAWVFCCCLHTVCFVGVVPFLDEFFIYLWGGWRSPHLTPLPSSSVSSSFLFIFNWRVAALHYSVGFCHTSAWISHRYTYVPSLLNLSNHFPSPFHTSTLS